MHRTEARADLVQHLSETILRLLASQAGANPANEPYFFSSESAPLLLREPQNFYLPFGPAEEKPAPRRQAPTPVQTDLAAEAASLDRTLVAGMFLQVLLEAENLPATPVERTNYIKKAVKNFLVQRLAGQITLAQFFRLVQVIEQEVSHYFHRLQADWLPRPELRPVGSQPPANPANLSPVNELALQAALARLPLPQQANRKLSAGGLGAFLRQTGGRWFRLLDFEAHFRLNKKTAWSYLSLLLHHGILRHNHAKANRVRYALAEEFLNPSGLEPGRPW